MRGCTEKVHVKRGTRRLNLKIKVWQDPFTLRADFADFRRLRALFLRSKRHRNSPATPRVLALSSLLSASSTVSMLSRDPLPTILRDVWGMSSKRQRWSEAWNNIGISDILLKFETGPGTESHGGRVGDLGKERRGSQSCKYEPTIDYWLEKPRQQTWFLRFFIPISSTWELLDPDERTRSI